MATQVELLWWDGCPSHEEAGRLLQSTLDGMGRSDVPVRRVHIGTQADAVNRAFPGSPTFQEHFSTELTAANGREVYVPEGVAHGFQTLEDNTEIFYQMSAGFSPGLSRGVRWNDPAFGIEWPATEQRSMNERDATYPDFGGAA